MLRTGTKGALTAGFRLQSLQGHHVLVFSSHISDSIHLADEMHITKLPLYLPARCNQGRILAGLVRTLQVRFLPPAPWNITVVRFMVFYLILFSRVWVLCPLMEKSMRPPALQFFFGL
jgi:hypothetical protein